MQYLMMVCLWCKVGKKYYFEIPISYWTRTCFWSADCRNYPNLGGGYVNAGSETNEQLVFGSAFKIKF
jgi:hypothetical protein